MRKGTKITIGILVIVVLMAMSFAIGFMTCKLTFTADSTSVNYDSEENIGEESVEETTETVKKSNKKIIAVWKDDGTPFKFGNNESFATIEDVYVENSYVDNTSDSYYLKITLEYTNNSNEPRDLSGDDNCFIRAYQNNIEIDELTFFSEDLHRNALKKIKNGSSIKAQLVFILENTNSPVELEFGQYDQPQFTKTIILGEKKK